MANTNYPECDGKIVISTNPEIGQRVLCQTFLEVIWLFPLSLERSEDQAKPSTPISLKREKKAT